MSWKLKTSSPTNTGTSTRCRDPQGEKGEFTARLAATADGKKLTVTNKQQADGILAALDSRDYTITKIEKGKRRRSLAALHHVHLAAGREPRVRLLGHPHDACRPDAV